MPLIAGNKEVGQCQRQCIGEVFEGSGCEVTGSDGSPVEGTLQVTGQCCNAEWDCASCTSVPAGSQCTIEDGPTQRTDPVKGLAGVLAGVLVNEIQPTEPVRPFGEVAGGILVNEIVFAETPPPTRPPVTGGILVQELVASVPVAWVHWTPPAQGGEGGASGTPPAATEPEASEPEGSSGEPTDPSAGEPSDEGSDETADETDETTAEQVLVVPLEGVGRTKVARLGKVERGAAFAFRLHEDGAFRGIDQLGQLYDGAWQARSARGSKLRVELATGAEPALEALLAESVDALGADPATLRLAGPARIELRTAKGGALSGRIKLAFEVELGGRPLRGNYVARLHDAVE